MEKAAPNKEIGQEERGFSLKLLKRALTHDLVEWLVIVVSLFCLFAILSSCSSARERQWYVKDVAPEKRKWNWCHESKDGPDLHEKGLCYGTMKCYKGFLGKEHCQDEKLFCAHGDVECLRRNFWPAVIKF